MRLFENFLNLIAPHDCLSCGSEGSLICDWCMPDVCPSLPERCFGCNVLSRDSKVCGKCRKRMPLKAVYVRTDYDGVAKDLIYKLKFTRAQAAAKPIAQMMVESLPYLTDGYIISHVPTASSRYRERGYDQAELIAKELARLKEVPFVPLLARIGQTRQVGARREQRQRQLEQAYRVRNKYLLHGNEIILVDDIVTTGATLSAAAKALQAAGAKRVSAAVFAQKTVNF